jgi:hypothetical protein
MTPVVETMVATPVLLLSQLPPGDVEDTVAIEPTHTDDGPVIGCGIGFTVIVIVCAQPVMMSV